MTKAFALISVNLEPIGTNRRRVPAIKDPDDQVNTDLTSHQPKVQSETIAQLERP